MSDISLPTKTWWRRFWWARGFVAALALFQLVPVFTDLSAVEFLRAFHAIIVGWHRISMLIGEWIGHFTFVPALSPELVNAIFLGLSLCGPGLGKSFFNSLVDDIKKKKKTGSVSWGDVFFPNFFAVLFGALFIVSGFWIVLSNSMGNIFDMGGLLSILANWFLSTLAIFFAVAFFVSTLTEVPQFAKGLFLATSSVLMLEFLYLLNLPEFSDWIDAFVVWAEGAPSPPPTPDPAP